MEALTNLFLALLKISLTAGITAGVILLIRPLAAKKLPRRAVYALWAIVLLRLVLPISLPSPTSIYTPTAYTPQQPISAELRRPAVSAPAPSAEEPQSAALPPEPSAPASAVQGLPAEPSAGTAAPAQPQTPEESGGPTVWNLLAFLWLGGAALLLAGGTAAYLLTLRKYRCARLLPDQSLAARANSLLRRPMRRPVRLYVSPEAESPLVAGIFRPRIILPEGELPDGEALCMVLHELIHIRRGDHLLRLLSLALLSLHWFNPLLWLAYRYSAKDMELSCDEAALSRLGSGMEATYAEALLAISVRQRQRLAPLLMFGESNLKTRVKNALSYKKASFWVMLGAVLLLAVGAAVLLTDPIREPELAAGDEFTASLAGIPLQVTADEQIADLLSGTDWTALEPPPEIDPPAALTIELDGRTLAFSVQDPVVLVTEGEETSGYTVPMGTEETLRAALLAHSDEYAALPAGQQAMLADFWNAAHLYGVTDSGEYFAVTPEYAASLAQALLVPGQEAPLPDSVPEGSFTLSLLFPEGAVPLSFYDGGENTLLVSGQEAVSLPVSHAELLSAAAGQPALAPAQPSGTVQIVRDTLVRWDGSALTVTDLASGELLRRTEREGLTVFSIRPSTLPDYAIEVAGTSAAEGAFVWSLNPADDGTDEFYTTFYGGSYDPEELCDLTAAGNYAALYARAYSGPNSSLNFTVTSGVRSDTPHHEERSIYIDSRDVKQLFSEAGRFWEDFTGLTELSLSNSGNTVAANLGSAGYPARNGFFLAAWDGEQWQQRWIVGTANSDTLLNSFYRVLEDGTIVCCVLRTNGWTAELIDPDTLETIRTLDFGGYSSEYLTLEGQSSEGNTAPSPRLDVRFCDRDTIAVLDRGFRLESPRLYLYDLAGNRLSEPLPAAGLPIAVSGSWIAAETADGSAAYPLSAMRETLAVRTLPAAPEKEPLPPEPETDPILMAIANNLPSLEQRGTALSFWTGWMESGNPFADPALWEPIEQANLTGLLPAYTGTGLQYEIEDYAAMNLYRADGRTVMELLPVDPEADPLCYRTGGEAMDALDAAAAELADPIYYLSHSPGWEISDFVNRNRLDIIDLACREIGLPRCYDYQYYILEGLSLRGETLLLEFNYRGEWDYVANKALAGLSQPDARPVKLDGRTLYEAENARLFVFTAGDSPALVPLEEAYAQGLADGEMLDEAINLLADKYPRLYRDETTFRVEQILNLVFGTDPETGNPVPTYNIRSYYRFQDLLAEFRASDEWAGWEQTLRAYLAEQEEDYSDNFDYALQLFYPGDLIRAVMQDARGDGIELAAPADMLFYREEADIYEFGDGFGFSYTYRRYPVSFTEEGDTLTVTYATLLTGGDSGGERPCVRIGGEYVWLGESWRGEPTLDEVQSRAGELPAEAFSTVSFVRENGRWVLP